MGGGGGLPDLLQYYNGGEGSLRTPNLYYVIYGRPLNDLLVLQPNVEKPFTHLVPGELQGVGPAGLGGDHGHAHLLRTHLRRREGRQP